MSTDDRFRPFDEVDPADVRPAKKDSGCLKWVLIFGAVGAVCLILCCGGFGIMGYMMAPKIATQPAEVQAMAQEIADIDIPAEWDGKMGMNMNLGVMSMKVCIFKHTEVRGMLQLAEMQISMGNPDESEAEIKKALRQQGGQEMKELNIEKSETREFEIRGEKADFTFATGTDSGSTLYHEVKGSFKGKTGIAVLHLQLEDEAWDEAEIEQMIKSIH